MRKSEIKILIIPAPNRNALCKSTRTSTSIRCNKEQCLAQFQSRLLRLLSPAPGIINKLYFSNAPLHIPLFIHSSLLQSYFARCQLYHIYH